MFMPNESYSKRVLLVGAGNMGGSMLQTWVNNSESNFSFLVDEPKPSKRLLNLSKQKKVKLNTKSGLNKISLCVFAVKPQMFGEILQKYSFIISKETIIISVVAGKSFQFIRTYLGEDHPIVRIMPNTPVVVKQGISALVSNPLVSSKHFKVVEELFSVLGEVVFLEKESQIDAVTALSGSGPAYIFNFIENLSAIGVEMGLPFETSRKLITQTVIGAGKLAKSSNLEIGQLRKNVTSPGGTTEAALEVLMDSKSGWSPVLKKAIQAAFHKSLDLGRDS